MKCFSANLLGMLLLASAGTASCAWAADEGRKSDVGAILAVFSQGDHSAVRWGSRRFTGESLYIIGKQGIDENVSRITIRKGEKTPVVLEINNGFYRRIFSSSGPGACYFSDREKVAWNSANPAPFFLLPECHLSGDFIAARSGYYTLEIAPPKSDVVGVTKKTLVLDLNIHWVGAQDITTVTIKKDIEVEVIE